jgi:iron(III) transport system substrate-binding protein
MLKKRFVLQLTAGLISVIAIGGCNSPNNATKPTTPGAEAITVYSARHYDADNQVYAGFTQKTGIKVNLVEAKANELVERLRNEDRNSPADVVITVDAGNLHAAKQAGVLQPIDSQALQSAIPANLRDQENYWFGLTKRARVIMYNKDTVDPKKIQRYEDLAKPDLGYKVIARSSNNIYNQSLVGSIVAADGAAATESWVKGLVANFGRPPEGNDVSQIKSLASGAGDLSLVNTYYLVRLAKSNNPDDQAIVKKVGIIFPNQGDRGTHINISGAGVAKYSPRKAAAIQLIEYLASPEAQSIFAGSNNEYPVLSSGVKLDPILAGYGTFKEDSLNATTIGENNPKALEIMDRGGWK